MPEVWLVCGSRSIASRRWVWEMCGRHIQPIDADGKQVTVMHGGARGVDRDADSYARRIGCRITIELPDYQTYAPKVAPIMRDRKMIQRLYTARQLGWDTHVLALWDGTSPGTTFVIGLARELGWEPVIERYGEETRTNDQDPATASGHADIDSPQSRQPDRHRARPASRPGRRADGKRGSVE